MNIPDLRPIETLMREVALRHITPRFGTLAQAEIQTKTAADDLVTIADLEAEAALTKGLLQLFPGCTVIGEESVTPDFDYDTPDLLFVIDPIDGTWPFAHGLPVFGTMIAVLSHGRPVAGLIHYPVTRDSLMSAVGHGVHHLRVNQTLTALPMLDQEQRMMTGLIPLSQYDADARCDLVRAFGNLSRIVTIQCSAYEYRMLLEGRADFCISTGLKPWDHHPGQLMLEELGGFAQTINGTRWPDVHPQDRLLSARNHATWSRVMAQLSADGFKVTEASASSAMSSQGDLTRE